MLKGTPHAADDQDMSTTLQRSLASSDRAGIFARRKARTRQRDYLRRNWKVLLPLYAALVACTVAPALFTGHHFVQGLLVGLGIAGSAGAIVALVIIQTGTGPTMAGELAEQWTVQELQDLLDHGYRLVNHVSIDNRGDVDHVLVGPGGLFVLETKWGAEPFKPDQARIQDHVRQLERQARRTWLQLKPRGVPDVIPVLVLWGEAGRELTAATGVSRIGDTYLIAGKELRRWLLGRAAGRLDLDVVDRAHEHLCRLALQTDAREQPVPASVEQIVMGGLRFAGIAGAAFLLPWLAVVYLHPATLLLAPALMAAGLVARRRDHMLANAVVAGAAASCLLALVAGIAAAA